MSDTVLVNNTLTPITGWTKDGTWQTVDLNALLNHDDPKMVVIHVYNSSGASSRVSGMKPVGSIMVDARSKKTMATNDSRQAPVSLAGGTTVQLFAANAEVLFYIHAEIGGDEAIINDDPVSLGTASPNAWRTIDATTRLGGDAGSVGTVILWGDWNNAGDPGVRAFGSIEDFHPNNASQATTFYLVAIDSLDRYQTYQSQSGGKGPAYQVWFYEAGFIKTGWDNITNPVDRDLNVLSTWTDEDITDVTSSDAAVALIRFSNGAGQNLGWIRPDGASSPISGITFKPTSVRHALVNLSASQVYEYYITAVALDQYILGWQDPAPPTGVAPTSVFYGPLVGPLGGPI